MKSLPVAVSLLVMVDLLCCERRSVFAFSCGSPTRARGIITTSRVEARGTIGGTLSRQLHQLGVSVPASGFFFSEEENDDDETQEQRMDTRMVNGSWSNLNQFPSRNFPQPIAQELEFQVVEDISSKTMTSIEVPSFLSVDGNGTGGLMQRSRGTGGANPTLMVPYDVNPNMRMVTPIDSGKETKKIENSNPSTVASYAALSALTQTTAQVNKEAPTGTQSSVFDLESNSPTNNDSHQVQQQQQQHRQLMRFEGASLTEENVHQPSDKSGDTFHSTSHNIKVKRFRGENSDDNREGSLTPGKQTLKQLSGHFNHHSHIDDASGTKSTASNTKSKAERRQNIQPYASLSVTRLVPFTGGSLMEEITRGAQDNRKRIPTSKLVKFDGLSEMDRQRQWQNQEESRPQSNLLRHGSRKLVPYRKAQPKSETVDTSSTNTCSKVVLYNKQATVASNIVQSRKREFYYIQYRPPTDATMARKTGLQVNTPISLWNERDKFLDS
jgi:hypothetical protein